VSDANSLKTSHALKVWLDKPPYGDKTPETRAVAVNSFLSIMAAIKESEIEGTVADLSQNQVDALLKFVYRGFEGGEQSPLLLKWHAAITDKHGLGSIARAMSHIKAI